MKSEEQKQFETTLVQKLIDGTIPITKVQKHNSCLFYDFEKSNIFYHITGWVVVGSDNKVIKLYLNTYSPKNFKKIELELGKKCNDKLSKKLLCMRQQKNSELYKKLLKIISKF